MILHAMTSTTKNRTLTIFDFLKCVLQERNRHSNAAIKVVGDANETIGHIPDGLSKVVALCTFS